MQLVCRACRSPGLTYTLAEQVKGIQDQFAETTHVPEQPILSTTPLLWPPTPGRSSPVTLLPSGVFEALLTFASSAHRQSLCKVLLRQDGKSGALAQPECFGGMAAHWGDSHSWMSGLQASLPTSLLGKIWEEEGEMRSEFE